MLHATVMADYFWGNLLNSDGAKIHKERKRKKEPDKNPGEVRGIVHTQSQDHSQINIDMTGQG